MYVSLWLRAIFLGAASSFQCQGSESTLGKFQFHQMHEQYNYSKSITATCTAFSCCGSEMLLISWSHPYLQILVHDLWWHDPYVHSVYITLFVVGGVRDRDDMYWCSELSEEELAKLSVRLLNYQSEAEGCTVYPCTYDMVWTCCCDHNKILTHVVKSLQGLKSLTSALIALFLRPGNWFHLATSWSTDLEH